MTTLTIGAARVTRIEEMYKAHWDAPAFFPDWRPRLVEEHRGWMAPDHYDPATDCLKLSIHSWLIRLGGRTLLVDTCVGNHKPRPARPRWHLMESGYLRRLAEAGVRPEEIDLVMCTHLHADHVGWNTRLGTATGSRHFPMPATSSAARITSTTWRSTATRRRARPITAPSATACCPWSRPAWRRW